MLTGLDTGRVRSVACESVIFTADWIPDNELAVLGGLELDPGTRGPAVDSALRTSRAGVFAAGNLLHGAETADVAALSGRHAAGAVASSLDVAPDWPEARVAVCCEAPLGWISPNVVSAGAGGSPEPPPRGRFALRSADFLTKPRIEVSQGGRSLWGGRLARMIPGRSVRLPHSWTAAVEPAGEPVTVAVFGSPPGG